MMSAKVIGLSSSFPENKYSQQQMKEAFLRENPLEDAKDLDFVDRVFKGTQIESCHSALQEQDLFRRMNKEEYITYTRKTLKDMGIRASLGAITEWSDNTRQNLDVCLGKITHIIWGSMTGGMHAPTMDIELIHALGLPSNIKRLNVENMGCLTGFRCLALASSLAKEDTQNNVLVVVGDVRNALGNLFQQKVDKSDIITASLFRDSCAAAIVTCDTESYVYEILNHESFLIPGSFDLVKYTEKDPDRVHLFISKDLPATVAKEIPNIVDKLTQSHNVGIQDLDLCCHTGGPRILNGIRDSLHTTDDKMLASWYVMKNYGNLSGSSNLVVLDHNRRRDINQNPKKYCVCLSMGPGVGVESLLLASQ